jgi:vancomycin resistance protein YoaR
VVRTIAGFLCLALASGLAGLALARRPEPPPAIVEIRANGRDVATGDAAALATQIARAWEREEIVLAIGDERLPRTRASLGATIDAAALARRIEQARDPGSLLRRVHATRSEAIDLPLFPALDPAPAMELLLERKDAIDSRPADARIEPRTGAVIPEREGLTLDVHATLDALSRAIRDGSPEIEAVVAREAPRRRASELEGIRLEAQLGVFETRYATAPDMATRTHNLHVAASRVDGAVLMPGETFDFDAAVGERSEVNGFRPAPQIAAGELVDGIGGGTCQIAGTLHAAAFFSGIPIEQRSPHSRPSTYVWMGLDAVVVYQRFGLRFTNDLPFPIALGMTVEGGVVRAEIRGARQTRMTTFVRRIEEVLPFRERLEDDPTLPAGVRVLRQRGVPGFRITRFRVVRDVEHNQARRTRLEDEYPPTDAIWRVGTGAPPPPEYEPPPGDDHPEYTADGYLAVTFGAGIQGLDIVRRGDATTRPGWTEQWIAQSPGAAPRSGAR